MAIAKVRVAILEDHQGIIDGYLYRLDMEPGIQVVATTYYGEELEPVLDEHLVDVLLLDIQIPVSKTNTNPFPVAHVIPGIMQRHPRLNILVISMHNNPVLARMLVEAGVNGYIVKSDQESIMQIAKIVLRIASGLTYYSKDIDEKLNKGKSQKFASPLTPRQVDVLSLCAAYPDSSISQIAHRLRLSESTVRNLLSQTYQRLGVRSRAVAVVTAQKLGLISKLE